MKNVAVIGNGRMAIECVRILHESPDAHVALVISELVAPRPAIRSPHSAGPNRSPVSIPPPCTRGDLQRIRAAAPTLIFSINSFRVIREPLLSLPPQGILNFHNGPLPRYRGMNACSWAIFNGETQHGVTWHFMTAEVDAGDIVAQRLFPIRPAETAATLIRRCLSEGLSLFRDVAPSVLRGSAARVQDVAAATRYLARDVPNGGWVSFRWDYVLRPLSRLLRLHPLPDPFARPMAMAGGRRFCLEHAVKLSDAGDDDAGSVLSVGSDGIDVQLADAVIRITRVLDSKVMR